MLQVLHWALSGRNVKTDKTVRGREAPRVLPGMQAHRYHVPNEAPGSHRTEHGRSTAPCTAFKDVPRRIR